MYYTLIFKKLQIYNIGMFVLNIKAEILPITPSFPTLEEVQVI